MTDHTQNLSRRERQIMDALFKIDSGSAKDIQNLLPDPPSYSAVRAMIAKLVDKGQIAYEQVGVKYIYRPAQDIDIAKQGALKRLVDTFFSGSVTEAVTGLLSNGDTKLSDSELDDLESMIQTARKNRGLE